MRTVTAPPALLQPELSFESSEVLTVPGLDRAIHVSTTRLTAGSAGYGRINIENRHLLCSVGFRPGAQYSPEIGVGFVFLRLRSEAGHDTLSVCAKEYANRDGRGTIGSRIDVRRAGLSQVFDMDEELLVAYCAGGVLITSLPAKRNAKQRWERLVSAAERGELTTGSLFTGIGTLDDALHAGLDLAGFRAHPLFGNDNWADAIEALMQDGVRPDSAFAIGIEQLVAMQRERPLPSPDWIFMGIPCKGASKLNVRDRDDPERHPVVGHQVLNVAMLLQALNHASPVILIENVVPWSDTVSCSMLRKVLEEQGYATELIGERGETTEDNAGGKYLGLNGGDYGDFERRRRMALLAFPPELKRYIDWGKMRKSVNTLRVSDIRLPEDQVSPSEYEKGAGLAAKAERGWKNRVVEDSATSTPALSAECFKQRPEDPKFRYPIDPCKSRLPLPEEHARLKGQPEKLIRSLAGNSLAHTALGNGTTRKVWVEFGRAVGLALRDVAAERRGLAV